MVQVDESRPFTEAVKAIRRSRRLRYVDLSAACDGTRSSSWFYNLVTGGRGAVRAPEWDILPELAALLGVTPARVAEMVAEEWYDVVAAPVSNRVRDLAGPLDILAEEDAILVAALIRRLSDGEVDRLLRDSS